MIFLTGDTHGTIDINKLNSKNFPTGQKLTKNDFVIILGDFGFLWKDEPDKTEIHWLKWFEEKPWTTLFVDGNHENHNRLNSYPVETWSGGKVHKINASVIHLMRGQVFNIENKTFFTMGGAPSVDKAWRTENISWWRQEEISVKEENEALNNLEKNNYKTDYIITHTCPQKLISKLFGITENQQISSPIEKFFNYIYDKIVFGKWFFGHWHQSINQDKMCCLYKEVIPLDEKQE